MTWLKWDGEGDEKNLQEIKLSVLQNILYSIPIYRNNTENFKTLQQEPSIRLREWKKIYNFYVGF